MARKMAVRTEDKVDDKNVPEYRMPGRPPRSPRNKVGTPMRFLSTNGIAIRLQKGAEIHGVSLSNYLRLGVYRQMEADGLLDTEEARKDATWDDLRIAGLV
jgi:hypothetical protein